MSRLNDILDGLTRERDTARAAKLSYQALLSPVRRLLPEIIQTIFIYCLPTDRNSDMRPTEASILLGHICRHWRTLALATPEIWSALHIVSQKYGQCSFSRLEQRRQGIETFLACSGTVPLNISLVGTLERGTPKELDAFEHLLRGIRPFIYKLKHLEIDAPSKVFTLLDDLTGRDVPLLETLSVIELNHHYIAETSPSPKFAADAPRLYSFTSRSNSVNFRIPTLPWSQIRYLFLETLSYSSALRPRQEFLPLFRLCSNLESFTYKIPLESHLESWSYLTTEERQVVIVLPHLRTLCIATNHHHSTVLDTLPRLDTPALKSIEFIVKCDATEQEQLSRLNKFLQGFTYHLYNLKLQNITSEESHFMDCLRHVPSLVELVLHDCRTKFKCLVIQPGHETLCLALEVLEFYETRPMKGTTISQSTCCRILCSCD